MATKTATKTALDAQTAQAQIQQMVEFIKQEAREKADELEVKTEAEFNIEKLRLIEDHKKRIRAEFKDKEKELATRRKIEFSTKVNQMRMKTITTREDAVNKIKENALTVLHGISKGNSKYPDLVLALIVQGMIRLREPTVVVRCREEDESIVSGLLKKAEEMYSKQMADALPGQTFSTSLKIDKKKYLPPNREKAGAGVSCAGGVTLIGLGGRIVVDQTLDQRLDLCYGEQKPLIRSIMFPSKGTDADESKDNS